MIISGKVSVGGYSVSGGISDSQNISGNVDKAENIYVKEIEFNNRREFPNIGKENMVYVAKDENKMYIFNPSTLVYEVVGSNYNEIEIIQGTL